MDEKPSDRSCRDYWLKFAPLLVSVSALILSGYSFYRTQLQVREGLLAHPLQFDAPGFGDPSGGAGPLKVTAPSRVMFQNTGNRSLVLISMTLWFVFRPVDDPRMENDVCQQRYAGRLPENAGSNGYGARTEQLPLVIPAGDIVLLRSTHEVSFDWDEARFNGTIPICVSVELLDSFGNRQQRYLPFANWQIWPEDHPTYGAGGGITARRLVVL